MSDRDRQKRILIIRTDRIGDVLLSTPVIEALRKAYPLAYIAMIVRPYAKDIVIGNPYLDEVILYDKYGKHKGILGNICFISALRKKGFDLGLILHPTNRVNIITFLAGVRERIGYNKKCGFLLTERLEDRRHLGEKHETEYALDVLRRALEKEGKGVSTEARLFMPIHPRDEQFIEKFLQVEGVKNSDQLIAIHPGASCPSKVWPSERFAQLADQLIEKLGAKIVLVSGPDDLAVGKRVRDLMHREAVLLCGKISLGQLAGLLKQCRLFISNDSGPVHMAVAVGIPVVSIFGRNEKGLSPRRWRPLGNKSVVLHKDVGCEKCLAHNCKIGFKCLKAITVGEVLEGAEKLLPRPSASSQ